MALTYDIEIRYLESGNLGAKLGDLAGRARSVGASLKEGFVGALDAIEGVAKGIAGLGLGAAVGMLALGKAVTKTNEDLEGTRIALASVFTATGSTNSFTEGLSVASKQMEKMQKDAAALPGEFQDLLGIFQTITPSASSKMGLGPDSTREIAAQTMAAAAIMRVPMNVAAREMAAMMEGHMISASVLARRMPGLSSPKEFNALSAQDRLKEIRKSLSSIVSPDVLNAFQHSFTGLFTTMKQNVKLFGASVGFPLFESIKHSLETINNWFGTHRGTLASWAGRLGNSIASAWEFGANAFEKYWGPVTSFLSQAGHEIYSVFKSLEPIVTKMGDSLKESLLNGQALETLKNVARLYLGMKIAAPLGGAALRGMGGIISGTGGLGLGIDTALGSAIGASGAIGALVALAGAAGELSALLDSNSQYHNEAVAAATSLTTALGQLGTDLNKDVVPALERFGVALTESASTLLSNIHKNFFSSEAEADADEKSQLASLVKKGIMTQEMADKEWAAYVARNPRLNPTENPIIDRNTEISPGSLIKAMGLTAKDRPESSGKPKVPNNITNINKVEIIVQSNQDPSRIARATVEHLANIKKNPKSGFIPRWLGGKQ